MRRSSIAQSVLGSVPGGSGNAFHMLRALSEMVGRRVDTIREEDDPELKVRSSEGKRQANIS